MSDTSCNLLHKISKFDSTLCKEIKEMKYTLNIFIVINCVNMADQSPFTTRINFTGKKILEVLGMREPLVSEDCEIFLVMQKKKVQQRKKLMNNSLCEFLRRM